MTGTPHVHERPDRDSGGLADLLRRRREHLGLRQQDVAARAHMSVTYLSRIECGDMSPTARVVERILAALGWRWAFEDVTTGADPGPARLAAVEATLADLRTVLSWDSLHELRAALARAEADAAQATARVGDQQKLIDSLRAEMKNLRRRKDPAIDAANLRALQAENRRYRGVLDALARQEVLTHDLIDQARAAAAGQAAAA